MIANLLEQADIFAQVDGGFLQGAVGELQPMALIKVRVNADDFARAREIVMQWERAESALNEHPVSAVAPNYVHIGLSFMAGLMVGILLMAS